MISYRPVSELKSEAGYVVIALVLSSKFVERTFKSDVYEYVIETLNSQDKIQLQVTYENFLPHKRGDLLVTPLKTGSGIEHELNEGKSYRFYLRSVDKPEILLVEMINE